MDKNAIKNFAIWARKELIERVTLKAASYEIKKDRDRKPEVEKTIKWLLGKESFEKREIVLKKIDETGFDKTVEEIAYTWFNRLIALRFMEVNGHLKSRIFTNSSGEFDPEILKNPLDMDIPELDEKKVMDFINSSDREGLFNYLLIAQCNNLEKLLPGIFEKIDDYTEILIPDNLLRDESVISKMIEMIPEEDWKNQVQILGWLYQYYNSEVKDEIFEELKRNKKLTKEKIPAATQLFTPDWIVRYMVENSLGKLWVESHPDTELYKNWRYYLEEPVQDEKVASVLKKMRSEYANIEPENIRCIDPSVGSGHVLCYLFDLLIEIYESYGYKRRDAVRLIIEKNIYALDIDERARQLAYFSVMMKALEYDRRFLQRDYIPQPQIYTICESNYFKNEGKEALKFFKNGDKEISSIIDCMVEDMFDACEYGSIVEVRKPDVDIINRRFDEIRKDENPYLDILVEKLLPLVKVSEILSSQYDIVITNPPYIGSGGMNPKLADYIKEHFFVSRGDIYAVFIEKWCRMLKPHGFNAMVTMQSWMFLSGFEDFRRKLFRKITISTLIHMDVMVMGIAFGTSATVFRKSIHGYKGVFNYIKRSDIKDGVPVKFPILENRYANISVDEFANIPGVPVAFWAEKSVLKAFQGDVVGNFGVAKSGVQTGDNNLFLKFWFEVEKDSIAFEMKSKDEYLKSGKKWVPQIKGGKYRKWYGNFDYVVNWENDGEEIRKHRGCRLNAMAKDEYYFKEGLTWSHTTSGGFGMRYLPQGALFNVEAPTFFVDDNRYFYYILGSLNTGIAQYFLDLTNSTQHYLVGNIMNLPIKYDEKRAYEVERIVKECIEIAKIDWDMNEVSWEFKTSPFVANKQNNSIAATYERYKKEVNERFEKMRTLEEKLGHIFKEIYEIELGEPVSPKDITVAKIFDSESHIDKDIKGNRYILTRADVIKDFISYGVGCILGRYSVEKYGVCSKSNRLGIVPITSDEYFTKDLVTEFVSFVEKLFGSGNLDENLEFIASVLKGKGSARARLRRYFMNDFYKEHCKRYEKRPIYWQFESGEKNALKILVYVHSYKADTLAKIRVDYIHELQGKYEEEVERLEKSAAVTTQRVKLSREIADIKEKIEELEKFEERVHHLADKRIEMDLDDGVKKNYLLFKDILTKI